MSARLGAVLCVVLPVTLLAGAFDITHPNDIPDSAEAIRIAKHLCRADDLDGVWQATGDNGIWNVKLTPKTPVAGCPFLRLAYMNVSDRYADNCQICIPKGSTVQDAIPKLPRY
jgi:hypothetical protein